MAKLRKDGQPKKTAAKRGEPGYHERNIAAAQAASHTEAAKEKAARARAIFPTAEAFTAAADAYFTQCDADGQLYGEAGLCLGLSRNNPKHQAVTLETLRKWYDGTTCLWLQEAVQMAYLRIQEQIESDPAYMEKGGMSTRAIFLQKQPRLGGYQDKQETKSDVDVRISFGNGVTADDFK